jgi:hypothetical protein
MSATVRATLHSISEVQAAIAAGESLFLAGSREALSQLPRGKWVGGSICYFMADEGGLMSEDRIFVTRVPEFALGAEAADYGPENLAQLYLDAPANGFTFVVMPAATEVLKTFAERAPEFEGFLMRPVVGWVAGVRADLIGKDSPVVVNGQTGAIFEDRCVALHVSLPDNKMADLDIVNIFESHGGDVIRFEKAGFDVTGCMINGRPANLADFLSAREVRTEFPLVGDYNGSSINVSFQKVDEVAHKVEFYAPVFPGVNYRLAKPVVDYERAFAREIAASDQEPAFACNCILNYLYGGLEGKKTGHITGPITFGEIAHQLLNQTMVRLYLRDVG